MAIRTNFHTERVTKHRNRLPGATEAPSLKGFNRPVDLAPGDMG